MTDDDAAQDCVFDVVFEAGFTFLESDFFADTVPSFFEDFEVFFANFAFEDGDDGDKNADDGENNKSSNTNHILYASTT